MVPLELKEKYFLVVSGNFERTPIEFDEYPNQDDIVKAIKELDGVSAKVEKRFVLNKK